MHDIQSFPSCYQFGEFCNCKHFIIIQSLSFVFDQSQITHTREEMIVFQCMAHAYGEWNVSGMCILVHDQVEQKACFFSRFIKTFPDMRHCKQGINFRANRFQERGDDANLDANLCILKCFKLHVRPSYSKESLNVCKASIRALIHDVQDQFGPYKQVKGVNLEWNEFGALKEAGKTDLLTDPRSDSAD